MSYIPRSEYKVFLYKDDYNAMCTEVYRHQNIETGGNLFGLWTPSGSAMIHVVLGPGEKCRRTNTSFNQDIGYMQRVGRFINDNYMLCHIGEWHSHHNLSLDRPSHGDEQTVERNFPEGMSKFLVIIANIRNQDTIRLSPYFFTNGGKRYEKAEYVVLASSNPFLGIPNISKEIEMGSEEGKRRNGNRSGGISQYSNTSSTQSHVPSHVNPTKPNSRYVSTASISLGNSSVPEPQSESDDAFVLIENPGSASQDHVEAMDTDDQDLKYPPRDYERTSTTTSPGDTSSVSHLNSLAGAGNQDDPETEKNVRGENFSARYRNLAEIYDALKKWLGSTPECKFKTENSERDSSVIKITFEHRGYFWMVCFPKEFPGKQAELFCSYQPEKLHLSKCSAYTVGPLNNVVNILLSIKQRCETIKSSCCDICKNITKESHRQTDRNQLSTETLSDTLSKLEKEMKEKLVDMTDLSTNYPSPPLNCAELKFKHGIFYYVITYPVQFPQEPATVQRLRFKNSFQREDMTVHKKDSHGPQPLITVELIIQAISSSCNCTACAILSQKRQ